MNGNDGISNGVFVNDLSSFSEYTVRKLSKFALVVGEICPNPCSLLFSCIIKSFRDRFGKLLNVFVLFGGRDTLTGLNLTRLQYQMKGLTGLGIEWFNMGKRRRCGTLISSLRR